MNASGSDEGGMLVIQQYRDRTALVTGTSRGIGIAIAQALAKKGLNLVLAARTASDLQQVAKELSTSGVRAIAVPTDLRDKEALVNLVAAAEAEFGAVDVLVNNVGFDSPLRFHHETPEMIEDMLLTNLVAPMVLTRLVLPGMLQRQRGHIVNIASLAAKIPFPNDVAYATSKAGLVHFTASLRAECQGTGVSASVVLPGQFRETGMAERVLKEAGVTKPKSVPTSPPKAAGRAVVRAIHKNLPEIAVPAPAILFTRRPRLGIWFLNRTQVTGMLSALAEARGRSPDEPRSIESHI